MLAQHPHQLRTSDRRKVGPNQDAGDSALDVQGIGKRKQLCESSQGFAIGQLIARKRFERANLCRGSVHAND